ncbi:MAG TPA: hypothetical protein VKJ07_04910, partial [Mycobacteriales bacterium]|nr:hypothetical protein [Mycobacteriales bacterium]
MTLAASGELQRVSFGPRTANTQFPAASMPTSTSPADSVGQDEQRLDLVAFEPRAVGDVTTSSVQVLPAGNVPDAPLQITAKITPTTRTRWLRSTSDTTLWSGSDLAAAAFTEVPGGSFFRATGPDVDGRVPVYYVGDG